MITTILTDNRIFVLSNSKILKSSPFKSLTLSNQQRCINTNKITSYTSSQKKNTVTNILNNKSKKKNERKDIKLKNTQNQEIKILIIASEYKISPFGPKWAQVINHIGQRITWTNENIKPIIINENNVKIKGIEMDDLKINLILTFGIEKNKENILNFIKQLKSKIILNFDSREEAINKTTSINGYRPNNVHKNIIEKTINQIFQKKNKEIYNKLINIYKRKTSDDLLFLILLAIDTYIMKIPQVPNYNTNLNVLFCMFKNCRREITQCLSDPECKKALNCLEQCEINDQVFLILN